MAVLSALTTRGRFETYLMRMTRPAKGLPHNAWRFRGLWTVGPEVAVLDKAPGGLVYRFHARDLHLVLGPKADGTAVRLLVTVDGRFPWRQSRHRCEP
jgi:Thioredoxin like C-terminal domain